MIVKVEGGYLQGKEGVDFDGNKYFSFQGIPYARPPVGKLRFKAPQPAEPWSNVLDATNIGNPCVSKNFITKAYEGSEDCLYLNVYSNNIPSEALQPVMVWIHGGAFLCGSGDTLLYGPEYLLTQNVVVVTFNYRLGILGFLKLKDKSLEVPGNAGLKDMTLAVKWVQKNISQFGGNPNNITIFGHSAGAASVNYLILSPTTVGLFHRAIILSGTATCHWAKGFCFGNIIASALGFNSTDETKILEFLQSQDAQNFLKIQELLKDEMAPAKQRLYAPSVEEPNPTAFITENPEEILKSGRYTKVPVMLGYTTQESIFLEFFQEIIKSYKLTNFEEAIPHDWGVKLGSEKSKIIGDKIQKFYFGSGDPSTNENLVNHYVLNTDIAIVKDVVLLTKLFKLKSSQPVFLYRFSAETELNVFKKLTKLDVPGVSHGDELPYLFRLSDNPEVAPGSEEEKCLRRTVKLFTNFAKFSNPTPGNDEELIPWKPVQDKEKPNCLDIGNDLKTFDEIPENIRIKFWEALRKLAS